MAKTATDIPITQGSGVNLSNFALASGRRRQTVILADADDAGEALIAELPAHDSVDRGSPLKIGGRASASGGFPAVAESDRTDAWFTLNGQQMTIATVEPATVYDAGRRVVGGQLFVMTAAAGPMVAGAAGLKTKVLSFNVACTSFSSAGGIIVTSGSGGFALMSLWVAALGNYVLPSTGLVLASTGVNADLWWTFSGGAGTFNVTMTWYQAP